VSGPLGDLRILAFSGSGPGSFAAMLLADPGAASVSIIPPGSGVPDASRGGDGIAPHAEIGLAVRIATARGADDDRWNSGRRR